LLHEVPPKRQQAAAGEGTNERRNERTNLNAPLLHLRRPALRETRRCGTLSCVPRLVCCKAAAKLRARPGTVAWAGTAAKVTYSFLLTSSLAISLCALFYPLAPPLCLSTVTLLLHIPSAASRALYPILPCPSTLSSAPSLPSASLSFLQLPIVPPISPDCSLPCSLRVHPYRVASRTLNT
jgi:hypothetical protein